VSPPRKKVPELYVGCVLAGYRLEERLGRGGSAYALRAERISDRKKVVFKVIRKRHREQIDQHKKLLREGKLMKALDHGRVMPCLDVGVAQGWSFLVMPYIEGARMLHEVLNARGSLELDVGIDYGCQILEALHYVHGRGVVHRDVKPENVMVDAGGSCYLTDFGLASTPKERARAQAKAEPRKRVGTDHYRPPEQDRGERDIDYRADLFSFGVTLHRMLTGGFPAEGAVDASLPRWVGEMIAYCLAPEPSDRPPSAWAVWQVLGKSSGQS